MNKDYLKISERIIEMTGVDIFQNTRKREYVELRALACYIFRKKMNMRWTSIANFFTSMGKKTDHASVIHLVKMYPIYKKSNEELSELESCFQFKSKLNYDEIDQVHFLQNQYRKIKKENLQLEEEIKEIKLNSKNYSDEQHNLLMLFDGLSKDRIDEIIERISLLKKSWSWKSKDKCQVIESSTSMDGMHW